MTKRRELGFVSLALPAVLLLILGLAVAVYLVGKQQIFQKRASSPVSCADPRYGLSQGSALSVLKLNPNAPLFSYGVYNVSGGNIHTFEPCSKDSSGTIAGPMGCVDKSVTKNASDPVSIYQPDQLTNYIKQNPGHWWTVFNEPDMTRVYSLSVDGNNYSAASPEQLAKFYHEYYQILMSADPTAKMFFPGLMQIVKNPDGTDAFYSYEHYVPDTLAAYTRLYGEKMPVSAWTMHVYPWQNSGCEDPAVYSQGVTQTKQDITDWVSFVKQIKSDGTLASPGSGDYATAEVWLTEWGWIRNWAGTPNASEAVNTACTSNYIRDIASFLETSPVTKWFYFPLNNTLANSPWCDANYWGIPNPPESWHCWAGWLYDNNAAGEATLTDPGRTYSFMANRKLVGCQNNWIRQDNSVPTGQTTGCLLRLYSGSACSGNLTGYGLCPQKTCSTDGTGVCYEMTGPTSFGWSSADVCWGPKCDSASKACSHPNWAIKTDDTVFTSAAPLKWMGPGR